MMKCVLYVFALVPQFRVEILIAWMYNNILPIKPDCAFERPV